MAYCPVRFVFGCFTSFRPCSFLDTPIKKRAREFVLLTRRYTRLDFSLRYEVPRFLLLDFRRAQTYLNCKPTPAPEIAWHSPRVPATAVSAAHEFAGVDNISQFIHNCHLYRINGSRRPVSRAENSCRPESAHLLSHYNIDAETASLLHLFPVFLQETSQDQEYLYNPPVLSAEASMKLIAQ